MSTEQTRSTGQSCSGGCLLLLIFLAIPVGYSQLEPHIKPTCPIEVRVVSASGMPQSGVEVQYSEGTIAPWIPIMPFGPARRIKHDGSVTTDGDGFARFRIKHNAYVTAVRLKGRKLIVHHATTKNWTGFSHTSDTINGAGIAQWFPAPSTAQVQTTEIVLADLP